MNIGIYGYGNLGRAVEIVSSDIGDINVCAVFTRRNPNNVRTISAPVYDRLRVNEFEETLDCLLLCGASYGDLCRDATLLAEKFNTVDSFDIHSSIEEYTKKVSEVARISHHTSIVSVGWDPGVLSLFRLYFSSVLPRSQVNTFWGRGVSQGHSAAVRRIDGVRRAVQYTVPNADALILANSGRTVPEPSRHKRECFIVAEEGREEEIEKTIKEMPMYFSSYQTEVHFISEDEFIREHTSMKHRGECIAFNMSGMYGEHVSRATLKLELDSNPEFTASVMLAYARACVRMNREERYGAYNVYDVSPSYLARCDNYLKYL